MKQKYLKTFPARLTLAFALMILITAFLAGIPSFGLIYSRYNEEAWKRIGDGERITLAYLDDEVENLETLAFLTSERPTLQRLIISQSFQELDTYLFDYLSASRLDILQVYDGMGELLASGDDLGDLAIETFTSSTQYASIVQDGSTSLILITKVPIFENDGNQFLGSLVLGIVLNENYLQQLKLHTGFEQSILVEGQRIVSTIMEDLTAQKNIQTKTTDRGGILQLGSTYYTREISVQNKAGDLIAQIEIATVVDDLAIAKRQALLIYLSSIFLITTIGSILGHAYVQHLTSPIQVLTDQVKQFSEGDLSTPIKIPDEPYEISMVAEAFEESRINTKRMVEEISHAKVWSETLIQSVDEGIITFDRWGNITHLSQGAEKLLECVQDQVLGRNLDEEFPLENPDEQVFSQVPVKGQIKQIKTFTKRKKPITLAVTGAELESPDGYELEKVLVLRDITEETALQNLRGYFLANITHEFRTPLTAIKASVELLLSDLDLISGDEIRELLQSIHFSLSSLQTLIDNLLESMSIEAGRFKIRVRPTMLRDIVTEAERVMRPLLDRREQILSIELPEQKDPIKVDPTRLTQVLINLLSNASKYSPIGEEIDLGLQINGDQELYGYVVDHGPGIPIEDREMLFNRYIRLDTSQSPGQYGIGLGLSVVKTIIEEHGGKVGVKDGEKDGSVFWFSFPIKENGNEGIDR